MVINKERLIVKYLLRTGLHVCPLFLQNSKIIQCTETASSILIDIITHWGYVHILIFVLHSKKIYRKCTVNETIEHCLICAPFFAEMVGAVIIVFLLAVMYEGFKTLRELLLLKNITKCMARKSTTELSNSTEKPPLNSEEDHSNGRQVILSAGVLSLHL